ncbi:hypothetical protein [Propionicicella superfundia]|uniref:hypothetical protein n=1 Tax=Propionicicella superfundia TaxID=348582 RepID=UPI000422E3FE|nr:hypothetical protein [Propionicicella superfundia]
MTAFEPDPDRAAPTSAVRRRPRGSIQWIALYMLAAIVLGALGAVVWVLVVRLPGYTVESDGKAVITQAGMTQVFQSDAWFAGIGAVAGLLLGLLAWNWFRTLGWIAPVLAGLAALLAGVTCWQLGSLMGPSPFDQRLATASAGDVVSVSLELHAPVALALWVMMAELPVLIAASLLRDPEDPPLTADGTARAAGAATEAPDAAGTGVIAPSATDPVAGATAADPAGGQGSVPAAHEAAPPTGG